MASIEKRLRGAKTRWVVRYRTPDHLQRTKTFDRKVDAEQYLHSVETTKNVGDYVDPRLSKITVDEWAQKWFAIKKSTITAKTFAGYEDTYNTHIKPRWGNVPLAQLRHENVQEWVSSFTLASATVRKNHRVLSMILSYAVKAGRLNKNVADRIDLPRLRSKEKRFLSHKAVGRLVDAVEPHYQIVVLFLAYTGLRFGEMSALRVHNLDLLRRRAIVCEAFSDVRGTLVLSDTKNHERREVPVPKFLADDLYLQLDGKGVDDLVFTSSSGAVLRSENFRKRVMVPASKVIGIEPGLTPHELRHTAASLAIAAGADVKVVQQMLGHRSATMTLDLYGHLFPDRLDQVAEALDSARISALKNF